MLKRRLLATLAGLGLVTTLIVISGPSAQASSGLGVVACTQGTTTGCTASAGTTGKAAGHRPAHAKPSRTGRAVPVGARVCKDITGAVIPCSTSLFGTVGSFFF